MPAPTRVSFGVGTYSTGATTFAITFPGDRQNGDLFIVHFLMNGSIGVPHADWQVKHGGDNVHAIAYCRVGQGGITAGSGALTLTFTDGGSAIYYNGTFQQVRGALASGDPFDVAPAVGSGTSTPTAAVSLTTSTSDCLLLWDCVYLFAGTPSVTAVPSGMTMPSTAAAAGHGAYEAKATAGASGSKAASLSAGNYNYPALMAIKPAAGAPPASQGAEFFLAL